MFKINEEQYANLIAKAKNVDYINHLDIVHDAIIKYDNYDDCLLKLFSEKYKYITHKELDLTRYVESKSCIECNTVKANCEFRVYKYHNIISTRNICIDCEKNKMRDYQIRNKEHISKYKKRYRVENKSSIKISKKIYYLRNKDEIKRKSKEYYLKNKKSVNSYKKKYYKQNFDKIKKQKKNYNKNNSLKVAKAKKLYFEKNKTKTLEYQRNYKRKKRAEEKEKKLTYLQQL